MKEDDLKRKVERGVAESFLLAYNWVTGSDCTIEASGEAPDLVCSETRTGERFGLEIAATYYGYEAAKAPWDMIRGRTDRARVAVRDPEATLAEELSQRLQEKWNKDYGPRCVLAIHSDAPLTTAAEFEESVLPQLAVPAEESPFEAVYVGLKGDLAEPAMVWWQVYPRKYRFYEQPRRLRGAAPGAGRAGSSARGGAARRGQRRRNARRPANKRE